MLKIQTKTSKKGVFKITDKISKVAAAAKGRVTARASAKTMAKVALAIMADVQCSQKEAVLGVLLCLRRALSKKNFDKVAFHASHKTNKVLGVHGNCKYTDEQAVEMVAVLGGMSRINRKADVVLARLVSRVVLGADNEFDSRQARRFLKTQAKEIVRLRSCKQVTPARNDPENVAE